MEDLNEEVVKKIGGVKKFPAVIVARFDFIQEKYLVSEYYGKFSSSNYDEIDEFLRPLALK